MLDENDDNSLLKMVGAMAAAAVAGGWLLWNKSRTKSPDEIEAEAFKLLEEADNPYSDSDLAKMQKARQMLEEVQARRYYENMRQQRLPVDKKTEQAYLDMLRHGSSNSDGNWEQYQEAFGRFTQQIRQGEAQLRPPSTSQVSRCDFCGGAGYNVCPTCGGIGRNNLMSPPNYTGDRASDELLSLRYRNDSACRHCNGSGQLICRYCNPGA